MKSLLFVLLLLSCSAATESSTGKIVFNCNELSPELEKYLTQLSSEHSIIGLGESSHAVAEFMLLRQAITEYAIKKLNYRTIVLEMSSQDAALLNDYLNFKNTNLDSILQQAGIFYTSREFRGFMNSLRYLNSKLTTKIKFAGIDTEITNADLLGLCQLKPSFKNQLLQIDSSLREDTIYPYFLMLKNQSDNFKNEVFTRFEQVYRLLKPDSSLSIPLESLRNSFLRCTDQFDAERDSLNSRLLLKITEKEKHVLVWYHNQHLNLNRRSLAFFFNRESKTPIWSVAFEFGEGEYLTINPEYSKNQWSIFNHFWIKNYSPKAQNGIGNLINHHSGQCVLFHTDPSDSNYYQMHNIGAMNFVEYDSIQLSKSFNDIIYVPKAHIPVFE